MHWMVYVDSITHDRTGALTCVHAGQANHRDRDRDPGCDHAALHGCGPPLAGKQICLYQVSRLAHAVTVLGVFSMCMCTSGNLHGLGTAHTYMTRLSDCDSRLHPRPVLIGLQSLRDSAVLSHACGRLLRLPLLILLRWTRS